MPRTARASHGGCCYRVLNRGQARNEVFHKPEDYAAFVKLLGEANQRVSMRLLADCLMPNHFHLVLWPRHDGEPGTRDRFVFLFTKNSHSASVTSLGYDFRVVLMTEHQQIQQTSQ